MSGSDTLAGAIELRAGPAAPQIHSSRPALARTLVRGKPAAVVPGLLSNVFALCGGAHRIVARTAIAAALGEESAAHASDARALQIDTLREHVRRLWLDWSRALSPHGLSSADVAVLRDCPLLRTATARDDVPATRRWLEANALDLPADEWLAAWQAGPADWLTTWTPRAGTLPARLLGACHAAANAMGAPPLPLRIHADVAGMRDLGARLRTDADFTRAPTVEGVPHETGPWTRLSDANVARYDTAWLRLGARLADAVRLALADDANRSGASWLRFGALPLAPNEGIAWCEMARGLLVHRVRLDPPRDRADAALQAPVAEYDVLAPTEWNFHPNGAMARALAQLPPDADATRIRTLAAAFDPCVEVRIGRDSQNTGRGAMT